MSKMEKQLQKAETEVKQIEMDLLWHERALRHRGFTEYSGLMSREDVQESRERRTNLRNFIRETRKSFKQNGN
jgi:hypothetical protein